MPFYHAKYDAYSPEEMLVITIYVTQFIYLVLGFKEC